MADELDDILLQDIEKPTKRFAPASPSREKPISKALAGGDVSANIAGARTDEELKSFLAENAAETVVIKFGSTWCHTCHTMFPHFHRLAAEFPKNKYVVAQVDYMMEAAEHVHYTPTFRFVRKGRTVDQFYGANPQALKDHLWLQSDD